MTAQRGTVSPPPGAAESLPQPFPNVPHPPYIVRDAVPLNPLHESPPDIYPNFIPFIDDLKNSLEFQRAFQLATLANGDLDDDQIELLRNPVERISKIDDDSILLSRKLFLSTLSASNQVYEGVRSNIMEIHPDDALLSYKAVKKALATLTGVIPIVHTDLCLNSCVARTGPFSNFETCPMCSEPRYDPIVLAAIFGNVKNLRQKSYTMPLGPQLQVQWRTPEGA